MEKIKENKKWIFVGITIFVIISIVIGIIVLVNQPKKITSIINQKTLNRVSYVTCSNHNEVSASAMLADFNESRFKPYSGDIGNTAHLNFTFMDTNNNILFTYTELGNNNLVEFRINGKINYYIKNGVLR